MVALLLLLDSHRDNSSHLDCCLPSIRLGLLWPRLRVSCLVCKCTWLLALVFFVWYCVGSGHLRRPHFFVLHWIVILSLLCWTSSLVRLLNLTIDFHDWVMGIFHHSSSSLLLFGFRLTRLFGLLSHRYKRWFTCQSVCMNLRRLSCRARQCWQCHWARRSVLEFLLVTLGSVEWLLSVHSAHGTEGVLLAEALDGS